MPGMQIKQSTFERLQNHAKPLVDTMDTVLNRVLDIVERNQEHSGPEEIHNDGPRLINPLSLPDLTHTKVLNASLARKELLKPNWTLVLENVLVIAMKELDDIVELRRYCPANMVQGRKEDEGYRYLPEVDISVQGMAANSTCKAIVLLARSRAISLEIIFEWRNKKDAAYPGDKARINLVGESPLRAEVRDYAKGDLVMLGVRLGVGTRNDLRKLDSEQITERIFDLEESGIRSAIDSLWDDEE